MEIGELLLGDKEVKQAENEDDSDMQSLQSHSSSEKNMKNRRRKKHKNGAENWVKEMREGLMVAASLLATMAFQAMVNPPGGVVQESKPVEYVDKCAFYTFLYHGNDCTLTHYGSRSEITAAAGSGLMFYYKPDDNNAFVVANMLSFLTSLSVILLLISGLPIQSKWFMYTMMITMWVAITAAGASFVLCLQMITPTPTGYDIAFIWGCLFAALAFIIGVGYVVKVTQAVIKWLPTTAFNTNSKKKKKNSSSDSVVVCQV
ncbi:PREDICTED: uncharacterized protein LOC109169141 [Ipomoea nil]|uniref:uncharacterized protein LOC109169141 n=1 Tax=Ipomoea nil TaxID=35883 RepID=UPI0009011447|nr:PREDICTED: uncharacterized protein LOC109169141 [Ipomoea nil]